VQMRKLPWCTLIVLLGLALNGPVTSNVAATNPVSPDVGQERESALASSPVVFIENAGQFDEGARFQMRGGDHTIWLAEDGIWVTVVEPRPLARQPDGPFSSPRYAPGRDDRLEERDEARAVAVRLSFDGANPHPTLEPFGRLETSVNYFIGNEPAQWQTNVPVWSGVRYRNLYPGLDLVIGTEVAPAQGGQPQASVLPWRLEVREEADLSAMRLRIEGADAVEPLPSPEFGREAGGEDLHLTTAVGEFTLPLLTVERLPLEPVNVDRVTVQTYDVTAPFTSAPLIRGTSVPLFASASAQSDLLYSTFLGGIRGDYGSGIAVDGSGSAYVTGDTESSDFPTTPGAFDTSFNSTRDAFVAKLSPDGSTLVYATFLGGSGWDYVNGITVNGGTNAYVTGRTNSSDFPTTPEAFDKTFNGRWDAFVAKLSHDGSALVYATFLGGSEGDRGNGIAVDGSGHAYVTGSTASSDFPVTPGALDTSFNSTRDAFVAKLSPDGSTLVYATFLGGSSQDGDTRIAIDGSTHAYVTGATRSPDFPTTLEAYDTTYNGVADAFIAKLSPDGSTLIYATFLGGSRGDRGSGIAVDGSGSAYVTGSTSSSDFPTTPGAFDTTHNGALWNADVFVAKLSPDGGALAYATFLGGNDRDEGRGIAVDGSGNALVMGFTHSSDFPTTPGAFDAIHNRQSDAFLAKLNADGSALAYATFLGGRWYDYGRSIAVDGSGSAYVTGSTMSSDFPVTLGAYDTTYNRNTDAFVAKLAMEANETPVTGTIVPIYPADHTTPSIVMQGGNAYRHFCLLDGSGNPIPGATVGFSVGLPAIADAQGHFTATIPASSLGNPGSYAVSVQSVTLGGQNHPTNNQPTFAVEVTERRYAHSWSYGAIRQASAGINTGLIAYLNAETNSGLGLTLEESDPDRTDDDVVIMDQHYSIESGTEVGAGIRRSIGAGLVRANLDASMTTETSLRHFGNLEAQFNDPYADSDRSAQGVFLTLSALDSVTNRPVQPLIVAMLRVAGTRLPYLDYISAQRVGTAARVTPIQVNAGADLSLTAQRSGSQIKGEIIGFRLLDVGASHLVAMVLTDYGEEYSVGFENELSIDLTMLSPDLPWIKNQLIGFLGNDARRLHKEFFFDSATGQLRRTEVTLSSEGNPSVFTDVTKKQVSVRMILEGPHMTPSLIEHVGQARAVSDLSALLNAVPEIPYSVEVEDGSSVTLVPKLTIEDPATGVGIGIGLGLEVEGLRNLIRERGVYLNGIPYVTESYSPDDYVARPGQSWRALAANALGGLWLLVRDAFSWVGHQVTSGMGWVIGTVSRTVDGFVQGGAQVIAAPGTQLYAQSPSSQNVAIGQTDPITVTSIGWVPGSLAGADALGLRSALTAVSGEGFAVGGIYEFQPHTLTFSPAATLVITYTDEAVTGVDETLIELFRWKGEGNYWQPIPAISDPAHNVFTATITQLGTFALGYDATPPLITILEPAHGTAVSNAQPLIGALVVDTGVGIDPATVEMRLDEQAVAAQYIAGTGELAYLPTAPLAEGEHTVQVTAQDVLGNSASVSATFTVRAEHRVYLPLVLRNR